MSDDVQIHELVVIATTLLALQDAAVTATVHPAAMTRPNA